ncbi:hypothetical protein TH5_00715 [Thalassospira xianhensis MCCC 1A02616]|uniref:Uncharacterized protein n=1 Tax=Thalassospira xianhensis MCCC 1A02616 TaxID=1177929 RepID=A0A367UI04_9PROT|nr:hypothetical protein TH5_00715 [Thalassospira xianhensis MCCC 1A02616]
MSCDTIKEKVSVLSRSSKWTAVVAASLFLGEERVKTIRENPSLGDEWLIVLMSALVVRAEARKKVDFAILTMRDFLAFDRGELSRGEYNVRLEEYAIDARAFIERYSPGYRAKETRNEA